MSSSISIHLNFAVAVRNGLYRVLWSTSSSRHQFCCLMSSFAVDVSPMCKPFHEHMFVSGVRSHNEREGATPTGPKSVWPRRKLEASGQSHDHQFGRSPGKPVTKHVSRASGQACSNTSSTKQRFQPDSAEPAGAGNMWSDPLLFLAPSGKYGLCLFLIRDQFRVEDPPPDSNFAIIPTKNLTIGGSHLG